MKPKDDFPATFGLIVGLEPFQQVLRQARQEHRSPVLWRLTASAQETVWPGLNVDTLLGLPVDFVSGRMHLQCEDGTQIPIQF